MAEFVPTDFVRAKDFLTQHHCAVLATHRKEGALQMSPITVGLDREGYVIISSRETAYKVKNLRRDPRASLCAFTAAFHGGGWVQVNGRAAILSLPEAMSWLMFLQRQVYGEHKLGGVRSENATRAARDYSDHIGHSRTFAEGLTKSSRHPT